MKHVLLAEGSIGVCWQLRRRVFSSTPRSVGIQPVNPKGNQSWIFLGRADAESLILWLPDAKNWLIWKNPDAGKIEGRRRGWQKIRWLDDITNLKDKSLSKFRAWWSTGNPGVLQSMGSQSHIQLSNWTKLNWPSSQQKQNNNNKHSYNSKSALIIKRSI